MPAERRPTAGSLDAPAPPPPHPFPRAWRWGAIGWLAIWTPAYAYVWGWRNFLALCDTAVLLGCLGIALGNRLLVGSQALPAVMFGVLWTCDVTGALLTGKHLFGGTEYMLDGRFPLAVRLLSFFHVALPVVLVLAVRRAGYDRRALPLQVAITSVLLVAARLTGSSNLNYAYREPIFHRTLGPAPAHLALVLAGITVLVYLPTHWFLRRIASATSARTRE